MFNRVVHMSIANVCYSLRYVIMALPSLISSGLGLIGGIVNTAQTNAMNLQISRETNKANRELVEMQNKAAKEEAELAYKRSSAPNQVALLQSAGMSRAGAINTLNGGGSYTPAPVNVSQDSAPQMQAADLSGFANIAQALAQYSQQKHDLKMQAKQLAAAKEQQQAQLESNERIAKYNADTSAGASRYSADSAAKTAGDRLAFDRERWNDEVKEIRARVANLSENTNYTSEQRKHFKDLRPILKDTAIEELERIKEEISNIKHVKDMDYRRFKLEKIRTSLESYYGVSIDHLRNTLDYWSDKPETLYKGFGFRSNTLEKVSQREIDFENYLDEVRNIIDSLD